MTFLSKGSLVFSVQNQKNMPQINRKEKTAHLGSHTFFLQEMLINTKTRHFYSSVNHQEQFFHRTVITGHFRLANIEKFLRMSLFIEHLQKQSFADIPQNRYS